MKRNYIPLRVKLAAALYEVQRLRWSIDPSREQPFAWRQRDSAAGVGSRFDWHHEVPHAEGGSDEWPNLTPRLREEHREQTRQDIARIAKNKRIRRRWQAHKEAMDWIAPIPGPPPLKRRWPSRPFPKRKAR